MQIRGLTSLARREPFTNPSAPKMTTTPNNSAGKTSSSEPTADRSTADIGIVCSHKGELKPFLKRVDRQRSYNDRKMTVRGGFIGEITRIAVVEAGEGFANHRAGAELLVKEHRPKWIISAGFSSTLADDVHPGDLVIANEIADTHGQLMPVKCTIQARKRIHVGKLIVADDHPITPTQKTSLREQHPGLAVDTGSLAVAQVCNEHGLKFLAIRGIVDAMNEEIPEQAASMIFHPTSRALGTAIGTMFKGLRMMSVMNSWRERTNTTASNLDRFLAGIVDQIAEAIERQRLG